MEDNFAVRLKHFIETEGLTNSQFADLCEIPRPSLSQIISGRNKKISDILIGAIHQAFPKLSILWLMFGEGEMFAPPASAVRTSSDGTTDISEFALDSPEQFADGLGRADYSDSAVGGFPDGSEAASGCISGTDNGIGPKTRFENPTNPSVRPNFHPEVKENGLTDPHRPTPTRMNTRIEADYRILNLQRQIDEMRQNPRRVTHITIYYDDSTFETFVPGTPK